MADIVEKLNQSIAFFEQPPPPKIAPPIWPIDHALRECRAEIERLRARNAALVEIVRDSPCPRDRAYITVGNCQQCGCSHGLLIGPLEQDGPK